MTMQTPPPRGKRSRHEVEGETLEDVDEERMGREEEELVGMDPDDKEDEQAEPPAKIANDEFSDAHFVCEPCGSSEPLIIGPDHGRVPKRSLHPSNPPRRTSRNTTPRICRSGSGA